MHTTPQQLRTSNTQNQPPPLTLRLNPHHITPNPKPLPPPATLPQSGLAGKLEFNFLPTFIKLVLSCLVPVILGKAARELSPAVRSFVQRHKTALSILSNTNLAILIWQTLSSAQALIVGLPFGTMLLLIIAAVLLHTVYLIFNTLVVMLLRLPMPEAACVVIMASQKVRLVCSGGDGGWGRDGAVGFGLTGQRLPFCLVPLLPLLASSHHHHELS